MFKMFKGKKLGFSIAVLILNLIKTVQSADSTDISRLRANILQNYDKNSRPVQSHLNTTSVELYFLYNAMEFDEQKGKLTLHLQTVLLWEDQHIKWDPLNYDNLTEITFGTDELWRPDLSVLNNFDESEIDHFGNTPLLCSDNSQVWWVAPTKFVVRCPTDYRLWPYDKQICYVHVASWSHLGDELDLIVVENMTHLIIDPTYLISIPAEDREWNLAYSSVERYSAAYCCPNVSFVDVLITVQLERKSSSHTAAVAVVGLGIAAAILISFWLDPFAHERIPITLLAILLNAIYLQYMYQTIPNNGATVPLAICFFRDSLVMVTFGLLWIVAIRYIAKTKRNSPVPLPDFVQTLLSSAAATILCLNPRPTSKSESQRKRTEESSDGNGDVSELVEEDNKTIQEDWEWLARLLDRFAFFAFLITYVVFIFAFL